MIFSDEESRLLDQIAIQDVLATLDPVDRSMIELRYGYAVPDGDAGPGLVKIGQYLPRLHQRPPLCASRVHQRITRVLSLWHNHFHRSF
ncbi:MAG TPA: hypothetical protein VNU46_05430 [Gemmatimonadaceae bacterium]|jgi:hypothetical protein|nr:hypothetical protein [Gemmatimonadaceae bacterium]